MSATSIINEDDKTFYFVSPTGITITGRTRQYDTYDQMLKDKNPPKFAWVFDASGDETVESGAAFYTYKNGTWQKLYESEAMDNENFGRPEGYDDIVLTVDNLKERVKSLAESTVLNDHINNNNIHITVDDRNAVRSIAKLVNNKVDKEEFTSRISNVETEISILDQTKMNLEDGLDLHNRIGLAEQELSSVTQRQSVTEATVSSAVTTVAETKTKVDNMLITVNGLQESITELNLRVDTNLSILGNVAATVEEHEDRFIETHNVVAQLQSTLNNFDSDLTKLKNDLASIVTIVNTIENQISNVRTIAEQNAEDIAQLKATNQQLAQESTRIETE